MVQKIDLALERKLWLDEVRTELTKKYRHLRLREAAVVLPLAEKMFDDAIASGKKAELSARSVVREGE